MHFNDRCDVGDRGIPDPVERLDSEVVGAVGNGFAVEQKRVRAGARGSRHDADLLEGLTARPCAFEGHRADARFFAVRQLRARLRDERYIPGDGRCERLHRRAGRRVVNQQAPQRRRDEFGLARRFRFGGHDPEVVAATRERSGVERRAQPIAVFLRGALRHRDRFDRDPFGSLDAGAVLEGRGRPRRRFATADALAFERYRATKRGRLFDHEHRGVFIGDDPIVDDGDVQRACASFPGLFNHGA